MPYSLVSAATLGFDLGDCLPAVGRHGPARRPGADARALAAVAAVHPGRGLAREERGVLAVRSRKARETGRLRARTCAAPHGRAGDRAAVLVAQLERGHDRRRPHLERLLRDDVLGPSTWPAASSPTDEWDEAADVLADAALGHWAPACCPRSSAAS
jgi:hypothetical protein